MRNQTQTTRIIIALLPLVAIFSSSCSSPTAKIDALPGHYILSAPSPLPNRVPARVVLKGATINDKALPEKTLRSIELETGVNNFIDLLRTSELFSSVSLAKDSGAYSGSLLIEVSFAEKEETHAAGAAAKGFVSGFFTLGLAPIAFDYSFESNMRTKVVRNGQEILSHTSVNSAEANGSHRPGDSMPERTIARKFVTDENNKATVHYYVANYQKF